MPGPKNIWKLLAMNDPTVMQDPVGPDGIPSSLLPNEALDSEDSLPPIPTAPEAAKLPPKTPSMPVNFRIGSGSSFTARGPASDLENELEQSLQGMMKDRKGRIGQIEGEVNKLGERPAGFQAFDLSPLMAYVDSTTGSKLSHGYRGPQAPAEYDRRKALLEGSLDKERGGLTDDQMNYLKMKAQERQSRDQRQMMQMLASRKADQADSRIGLATARLQDSVYKGFHNDANMKNYDNQLNQVDRGYHVLENPPDGILTYQQLKEISNDIANALAGGRSAVDDRHKAEYNTFAGEMARITQYMGGKPQNAVADPQQVAHLRAQLLRLKEAFAYNMADRARTLASGRDYVVPAANEAAASTVKGYQEKADKMKADANEKIHGGKGPDPAKLKRLEELRKKMAGG